MVKRKTGKEECLWNENEGRATTYNEKMIEEVRCSEGEKCEIVEGNIMINVYLL